MGPLDWGFDRARRIPKYVGPKDYEPVPDALFRNNGNGTFTDVSASAGITQDAGTGMGMVCLDFEVELYSDATSYEAQNTVQMNLGNEKFADVSDQCGDGLAPVRSSRGAGFDDLDNDGDIDIVVQNSRRTPNVLRNESQTSNHWIQIRLCGTKTNRDGVGAHVRVIADDLTQLDEVHSGRGYQSHHGLRLHFGLGARRQIDRVAVRWIGGREEIFTDVPSDQLVTLIEGTGEVKR